MNVTDPIGDLLTVVRNGYRALKPDVEAPASTLKAQVCAVLKREGYIADFYQQKDADGRPMLKIQLKIIGKECAITGIKRVSKPGLRKYVGSQDMPRVLGGMGISIITTSRGVMTGHEARKANVGGEVLAYVW
jgi:small subunit ribosomal protein S8